MTKNAWKLGVSADERLVFHRLIFHWNLSRCLERGMVSKHVAPETSQGMERDVDPAQTFGYGAC